MDRVASHIIYALLFASSNGGGSAELPQRVPRGSGGWRSPPRRPCGRHGSSSRPAICEFLRQPRRTIYSSISDFGRLNARAAATAASKLVAARWLTCSALRVRGRARWGPVNQKTEQLEPAAVAARAHQLHALVDRPHALLHCFDERLSYLDDIRGKLSRIAAANIPRPVDRSGRDEQGFAGPERYWRLSLELILERAFEDSRAAGHPCAYFPAAASARAAPNRSRQSTRPPLRLGCDLRTFDRSIQRSDLNAALSSDVNSSGCSHAAKWPPLGSRL